MGALSGSKVFPGLLRDIGRKFKDDRKYGPIKLSDLANVTEDICIRNSYGLLVHNVVQQIAPREVPLFLAICGHERRKRRLKKEYDKCY